MYNQPNHLSNIRSFTSDCGEFREWLTISGGILLSVVRAKLLFTQFDSGVVSNPSLMDRTGKLYWDMAVNVALLALVIQVGLDYWYNQNFGRVIP